MPAPQSGRLVWSTFNFNFRLKRVNSSCFTGHEMLDDLGLVHMNGRIYDPLLGRFLSADLVVQAPGDLQSFNRYSYVWNSPLRFVDPTGFEVYAAARDLAVPPVGKHQFTIAVPDDPSKFKDLVDLGGGKKGIVLGAHPVDGRLRFVPNQESDLEAAKEWADPKTNVKWYKVDFDTETKLVPTPEGKTDAEFISELVTNAANYNENENEPGKNIPYPSASTNVKGGAVNSNSWNQSLIESADGEVDANFKGADRAHDKRIDPSYFEDPKKDAQSNSATGAESTSSAQTQQQQDKAAEAERAAAEAERQRQLEEERRRRGEM